MRPIPEKLKKDLIADPYYKICARRNENCSGRITFEHCWIYARKQINEKWAIIPLCWYHHLGAGMNKELNQWISIQQASWNDLKKYPKKNWLQIQNYLFKIYGQ